MILLESESTEINLNKILEKTRNRFLLVKAAMKIVEKLPRHELESLRRSKTKLTTYLLELIQDDKVKIIEK